MRIFLLTHAEGEGCYHLVKKERNYLLKVLRLSVGDVFTAKDEKGCYYKATIISESDLMLTPTEKPEETLLDDLSGYRKKIFPIEVFQCICKGKKNEDIVRMLTEAGIQRINFVRSRYTQQTDFTSHELERLEKIRKEAIQQSGSDTQIAPFRVFSIEEAIKASLYKIILLHQGSREKTMSLRAALSSEETDNGISLIIGSEGGFSDEECSFMEENNAIPVLLPTNILRAETAGIFAVGGILSLKDK